MGIRGLFTYIHNNNSFWINISQMIDENKRSDGRPSKIIIDGPNLANQLHKLGDFDSLYGGQYQEYYETVRGFLEAVINTGFTPIVVLEETMEERKRETILIRRVEKLKELDRCVHEGSIISKLPRMGYIIFTQAVLDLKIERVSCDSEADPVIAALASSLNAYIMSSDSDFFFTCIPGVFSVDFLSWPDGVLTGSCYHLEYFLEYHRLQLWMVPFVVMMLRNDFIPEWLFQEIEYVREKAIEHLGGRNKIWRVLQMIGSFRSEKKVLEYFESRLSQKAWRKFQDCYDSAVSSYLCPNSLVRIDPSLPHYGLEYRNVREKSDLSLDSLLRVAWAWGAVIHRETLAQCNNEDFQRDPATNCSLSVRQYLYSFILRGGYLVEIGRNNSLGLRHDHLELFETLPNGNLLPDLDEVLAKPESDRFDIFLQVVQCSNEKILRLEDPWRMLAFSLNYWYSHCNPKPPGSLLEIIIVSCLITYKHPWRNYSKFSQNINHLISKHLLSYHQVAQWHATQHDIYKLALLLAIPNLSPCVFSNGRLLFQIIMDREFRENQLHKFISVQSQLWIHYFTELIVPSSQNKIYK